MTDDEIKQLVASNAKAIQALTSSIADLKQEWQEDRQQWEQERSEWKKERSQFYGSMTEMQRQFIDQQRRIDDNSADIRELILENKRILSYLEGFINRPGSQ